jgi:hypothetical protein
MTERKRNSARPSAAKRERSALPANRELVHLRRDLQATILKLRSLGCADTMILVEFWHALDCVNGERPP